MGIKNKSNNQMDKIQITEIKTGEYYINIFSETGDDLKVSNGFVLKSNDLYSLYIQLREIFTKNN